MALGRGYSKRWPKGLRSERASRAKLMTDWIPEALRSQPLALRSYSRNVRFQTLDAKTGELRDRLADTLIAFCTGAQRLRFYEKELVFFLGETRNAAWTFEAAGVRPKRFPKQFSLTRWIARTRPLPRQDVHTPTAHCLHPVPFGRFWTVIPV
jgi:hypothetical protein